LGDYTLDQEIARLRSRCLLREKHKARFAAGHTSLSKSGDRCAPRRWAEREGAGRFFSARNFAFTEALDLPVRKWELPGYFAAIAWLPNWQSVPESQSTDGAGDSWHFNIDGKAAARKLRSTIEPTTGWV
jgi:hypothetical protein